MFVPYPILLSGSLDQNLVYFNISLWVCYCTYWIKGDYFRNLLCVHNSVLVSQIFFSGRYIYLSLRMTKSTKWHMRPSKTQISLGIRPVWSESSLSARRNMGFLSYPLSALPILWSDWADASLIWVFAGRTDHFVGFVMRWFIYLVWI